MLPQPIDFLFYIRFYDTISSQYFYYYVDGGNTVQTANVKKPIKYAPKGWMDEGITWERNFEWFGVYLNYTNQLEFVFDSGKILRWIYYTYGVEAKAELYIEKFNRDIAIWDYEDYCIGDFDFSLFNDKKDFVNCAIIEGGYRSKLTAREGATYAVPITNNPLAINVLIEGIYQKNQIEYTNISPFISTNGTPIQSPIIGASGNFVATINNFFKKEGYFNGDLYFANNDKDRHWRYSDPLQQFATTGTGGDQYNNGSSIYNFSAIPYIVNFEISDNWQYVYVPSSSNTFPVSMDMALLIYDITTGIATSIIPLHTGTIISAPVPFVNETGIAFNGSFTLPPNSAAIIGLKFNDASGFNIGVYTYSYNFDLLFKTVNKKAPSFCKVLKPLHVFQSLATKINDNSFIPVDSQMLDDNENLCLTSGNALRNLSNTQLKTSLNDFYSSYNSILCLAMQYDKFNNQLNLINRELCYDNNTIIQDIGSIASLDIKPFTSEMFSSFKYGFGNYSYDDINGKDEFNKEHLGTSPVLRVVNEKDLTCKYRADMYGIEQIRDSYVGNESADSINDQDNEVYLLDVDLTQTFTDQNIGTYYKLKKYNASQMTFQNVLNTDTAINLSISPKRNLLRHGRYLRSLLYQLDGKYLKRNVSSKDYTQDLLNPLAEMVTTPIPSGAIIDEGADVLIDDLGDILFKPVILTITCHTDINIYKLINNSPYGLLKANYKGVDLYGFILKANDTPVFKSKQTFELLCAPQTDLSMLIV